MATIARRIMKLLGDDEDGYAPPGTKQRLRFAQRKGFEATYYATTDNNEGHELWLGVDGLGWQAHYRAAAARRLAWFILWDWWIVGTWCGLKRRLWYWALFRDAPPQFRR
jgi:hypothetical protein